MNNESTCCFIGHKHLTITPILRETIKNEVIDLITKKGVIRFLFGSKSYFNTLCYSIVSELQKSFPHIRRIYVRADYVEIEGHYESYLLSRYEETYYPKSAIGSTRLAYVKRNQDMIDNSLYCVFYYDSSYTLGKGTKVAFEYAKKKKRNIINIFDFSVLDV